MENTRIAYTMQYGEIFAITAVVCVVGALASLLISDREPPRRAGRRPGRRRTYSGRNRSVRRFRQHRSSADRDQIDTCRSKQPHAGRGRALAPRYPSNESSRRRLISRSVGVRLMVGRGGSWPAMRVSLGAPSAGCREPMSRTSALHFGPAAAFRDTIGPFRRSASALRPSCMIAVVLVSMRPAGPVRAP